jgi:regulator of protease activity HflC (stomatin/prohibitin superfamily)
MPDTGLPPDLDAAALIRRLAAFVVAACAPLAALAAAPARLIGMKLAAELHRSGIAALPLAALMVALAGLLGTAQLTRARAWARAQAQAQAQARVCGAGAGRAARLPQVFVVPALALPAAALAWSMRPLPAAPACPPHLGFLLGGMAVALAFALLVAERTLALTPRRVLPEAPELRTLMLAATGAAFLAGVLEILAQLGLPGLAGGLGTALALAALRVFLPPPPPDQARAATYSLIAHMLAAGAQARSGVAAPIRQHLGIDFSRSWALAYARAAVLPLLACFLLLGWGLTGVTLVPIDGRAIYERFGAPVRVLHPGLHVGLPWPLGTSRPLEYGRVHDIGLVPAPPEATQAVHAEDPAPAGADRLWDTVHPAEIALVIASDANARQSFQSVSADLRVLFRIGLTDEDALRAAYATADPEALVRAAAGRVVADYFAARSLDAVLGANREAMAATLRGRLQMALDGHGAGLDIVEVVIEAVHPPAGAAEAYHNVRAAEIAARTSIAVEHGAAATVYAQSRQYAYDMTAAAHAAAAETVDGARTNLIRFTADQSAARTGPSFMLERYFTALSMALAKAPKTIIDHRLNWPEAPVLDLRPFTAATGAGAGTGTGTGKEE